MPDQLGATAPWWEKVPDDLRQLARSCCANPDQMVLPYQAALTEQPGGLYAIVQPNDLVPYWTRFLDIADRALGLAREATHQPELDALWATKEAYRFFVDASAKELAERGVTRIDALIKARQLDAALPPDRTGDNSRWVDTVWPEKPDGR